jgi:phosphoglycolate phosphatase
VVFDLDGTLVDSAGDLSTALDHTLIDAGRAPLGLAVVRQMVGDGAKRLIADAFQRTGSPIEERDLPTHLARFFTHYEATDYATTVAFPGVPALLAALSARGIKLGVATNKSGGPARAILRRLQLLTLFGAVVGSDEVKRRKPDPEHLYEVLARLGVDPADTVYVGDNEHDAAAGRLAGCRTVLVRWGYCRVPIEELPADAIVDGSADLGRFLNVSS